MEAKQVDGLVVGVCLTLLATLVIGGALGGSSWNSSSGQDPLPIAHVDMDDAMVVLKTHSDPQPQRAPEPRPVSPQMAPGMNRANIDRLTTYAVVLGRATACGVNTSEGVSRVAAWMDRVMPPGSTDQPFFLTLFAEGTFKYAELQASGRSPDTCEQVRSTYARMVWP